MGTLVGHVAPGFGFLLIGLWHLFNHTKLHFLNPETYKSPPWFKTSFSRYLELILIMVVSTISIAMELFIGPERHQPLDSDWTIPSNHLHNFEHSLISLTFFTYAAFAIVLDRLRPNSGYGMVQLLGAFAFGQQLLLFRLHSADHMGVEGQYHLLLQLVVFVSMSSTLLVIAFPKSYLLSFVRSLSITTQGVWFIVMGFALWTAPLIPKGCWMNDEEGHWVVRCRGNEALHRAKSLVNIQFSFTLVFMILLSMGLYLILFKFYGKPVEYRSLDREEKDDFFDDDLEFPQEKKFAESKSFIEMGKGFSPIDIER